MASFATDKEEEKVEKVAEGATAGEDDDGEDGPAPEEESTATFAPIIKLEAVEVKKDEDEEDVLYCR